MSTLPKTDSLNINSPHRMKPNKYFVFDDNKNASLSLQRPPLSLWDGHIPNISGVDVTEDEKAFTVAISVPNYEMKDIKLNFDKDKHMLRLTGKKDYTEGDTKVRSSFEKAISLRHHDIDANKLDATLLDSTLTVIAPKKFMIDEQFSEATTATLEEDAAEDEIFLSTGGRQVAS